MAEPIAILVTGGAGQVGSELQSYAWPEGVRVLAPARSELDLTDAASVSAWFSAHPVAAVINPAAYTAVDRAETEVGAAFAANALAPALLAGATRAAGVPLVHVSTDYVFDGQDDGFNTEDAPVAPLGVYGASKLAGELAVRSGNPRSVIVRTAWVLSVHRTNFLKTMLRLAGDRDRISVVADQFGCPTSARDIAQALATITLRMISDSAAPTGVYHFVNAGETSWSGLAQEIFAQSARHGGAFAEVTPIATADYPTPARRPANSRLSTTKITADYGVVPRPWRDAVAEIVEELSNRSVAP
ncbi:MAG TPA: dTDP-4-dehydrorhamnose reductase [Caulobacter sp.]|nr:dTDP-4-dehydrorhamnose reductase [Caulobacter sp.]